MGAENRSGEEATVVKRRRKEAKERKILEHLVSDYELRIKNKKEVNYNV